MSKTLECAFKGKEKKSKKENKNKSQNKTRQEPSPRHKEIENLKNEIRILKQSQINSITGDNPKNAQVATIPEGQATTTFIQQNRNAIGIQQAIKSKIRYEPDPSEHVINLSKHSFSLDAFKILNKNLNFVPTPKRYNKK